MAKLSESERQAFEVPVIPTLGRGVLLADGFTIGQLSGLVIDGLATFLDD